MDRDHPISQLGHNLHVCCDHPSCQCGQLQFSGSVVGVIVGINRLFGFGVLGCYVVMVREKVRRSLLSENSSVACGRVARHLLVAEVGHLLITDS